MKIVRALWEHYPSRLYKKVKCSALVIAAHNKIAKGSLNDTKGTWVEKAAELLPRATVIWLEDTIHHVPLQTPKTLANEINKFIDNEFLAVDSLAYRTYLTAMTPDIDLTIVVELDNGEVEEVAVPVTARFFWPSSRG